MCVQFGGKQAARYALLWTSCVSVCICLPFFPVLLAGLRAKVTLLPSTPGHCVHNGASCVCVSSATPNLRCSQRWGLRQRSRFQLQSNLPQSICRVHPARSSQTSSASTSRVTSLNIWGKGENELVQGW